MSHGTDEEIVSFTRAPVVEVVCGAQFQTLPLQTAHFGQFWERVRDVYGKTLDAPPLPAILEGQPNFSTISWSNLPELRRVFFLDEARGRLLQLQSNRLHHNWQRHTERDVYPRFGEVRSEFLQSWGAFTAYLREAGLPPPHVIQGEVTYINHIPFGDLWDASGFQKLFPWLSPKNGALTPTPELEVALHYEVPECLGRLHVTIRTGVRDIDKSRVVLMDLTMRGAPASQGPDADLEAWLGAARRTVVRSFAELTGPDAHAHWGRVK